MPDKAFMPAPEVAAIARELINQHHTHLVSAPILYLFCEEPEKVKGREVLGSMRLISGRESYFAHAFLRECPSKFTAGVQTFVMTINSVAWNKLLSPKQKVALVDHELCHAEMTLGDKGEISYKTVGHDLEEFNAVVRRHGPWLGDIVALLAALKNGPQLTFEEIAELPEGALMRMPPVPKEVTL